MSSLFFETKLEKDRYLNLMIKSFYVDNLEVTQKISNKFPTKLVVADKLAREYLFCYKEEKYFLYISGKLNKSVYFSFFETSRSVDLLDICLGDFSNLGIGSAIIFLLTQYANQKHKNFRVRLCSNYWLINFLKNNYPDAKINVYDFLKEKQITAKLSRIKLFEVFDILLVRLPFKEPLHFQYNPVIKEFISLDQDKFKLVVDNDERLLLKDESRSIVDFQVYCYNQITTITNSFKKKIDKICKNNY